MRPLDCELAGRRLVMTAKKTSKDNSQIAGAGTPPHPGVPLPSQYWQTWECASGSVRGRLGRHGCGLFVPECRCTRPGFITVGGKKSSALGSNSGF